MSEFKLTDEMIAKAAAGFDAARREALPAPEECEHEFPDGFYESLLQYAEKKSRRRLIFRRTIAALLTLLLGSGIFLTAHTEARAAFFAWMRNGFSLTMGDLRPTDELVLYVPKYVEKSERHKADLFRILYGVNVRLVVIGEDSNDYDVTAYTERVMEDLEAGGGPDILSFEYLDIDIARAVMKGQLLDLTDIMADDEDFSEEDYLDGVFEAGRFGGRQYTVPLSVYPNCYLYIPSKLEELGFRGNRINRTSDFVAELARMTPAAAEDASFQQMLESKNMFSQLFRASDIRLYDYETGTVLPDERSLSDFLRAYKAYFPYDYDGTNVTWWHGGGYDSLMDGLYCFWEIGTYETTVWGANRMKDKAYEYGFLQLPDQTGKITGTVYHQLAINANARNTLNAYQYIKLMLTAYAQIDEYRYYSLVPVSREAVRTLLERSNERYAGYYDRMLDDEGNAALSAAEMGSLYAALTGNERYVQPVPYEASELLYGSMLPYFQNEKSYGDCLKDLKNKLESFYSE